LYPLDALPPTAVVPEKELPVAMSKKLFVGGLSWGTTDDGLHSAFSQFGEIVEAKVITDRETGRSRGFGFVTFSNDEGATKAIAEMDGTELDGRTIKVNEAEDKPARTGGGGGGRGGYGGGGGGGRGGRSGGGGGGRGGRGGRDEW
jgi:RNA recognition motif-containing protein